MLNVLKLCVPFEMIIFIMSKRVKGSLPYLQVIARSKPKLRKLLIDHVPARG